MTVQVTIPGLLASSAGHRRHFDVEAETLDGALRALRESHPLLRRHIWDEAGNVRPHVLVYLNDECVKWIDDRNRPICGGDRLQIIQAVSGG
ncbi:MAG: MoaD/ThiS family protein [Tepidisphaeraceae bacterium]